MVNVDCRRATKATVSDPQTSTFHLRLYLPIHLPGYHRYMQCSHLCYLLTYCAFSAACSRQPVYFLQYRLRSRLSNTSIDVFLTVIYKRKSKEKAWVLPFLAFNHELLCVCAIPSHGATLWWKLHVGLPNFNRFWLTHPCDGQTDGRTDVAS